MCAIVMTLCVIKVSYVLMSSGLRKSIIRRQARQALTRKDSESLRAHRLPFLMSRPLPLSPLVAYNKGRGAGSRYTTPLGHREPSSTAVLLWWTYYALDFLYLIIKKGSPEGNP